MGKNRMFSNRFIAGIFVSGWALGSLAAIQRADAATVKAIDFQVSEGVSEIQIQADSPLTFEKIVNDQDNQLILNLAETTLSTAASRKLDTSSFDSPVNLISPYEVDGASGKDSRVVIQLRENAPAEVLQDGDILRIRISNSPNLGEALPRDPSQAEATVDPGAIPAEPMSPDPVEAPSPEVAAAQKSLDQFESSQQTRRFIGKPVTLNVRDADLVDVFRLIGEASGFNIVIGEEVKGKITLALNDVPWDQALDLILRTQRLGAERSNNVLRILTLESLTKEKQQEVQAKLAVEASAPRVTRVFPISYAKLEDLAMTLQKFSTTPASGQSSDSPASQSAIVQPDERTNSIIIRDLPESINRMKKLIEVLDTQTPQILIEAKIIEASENFARALGGRLGIGNAESSNQIAASFNGGDAISPLLSTTGGTGTFGSEAGAGAIGISFLPGAFRLNAVLTLQEREGKVRVVSSPRTVVLNKEKATILQSTPVAVPTTTTDDGATSQGFEILQANLSLGAEPTVTNDGSVLMSLEITRDIPQSAGETTGVAQRNMKTKVLVESGSTLVIGGIYTVEQSEDESGIPWLRKIPLIGLLFGNESRTVNRSELFIFITPRILNEKEAGLVS